MSPEIAEAAAPPVAEAAFRIESTAALLALFAAGKLRSIVGQHVPFVDLPAALDAMKQTPERRPNSVSPS
jgi:hypothetical protein